MKVRGREYLRCGGDGYGRSFKTLWVEIKMDGMVNYIVFFFLIKFMQVLFSYNMQNS